MKTNNLHTQRKVKRIYRIFSIVTLLSAAFATSAFASDPITVISNLSDFIFSLIKVLGIILGGWGVLQFGLSFQSNDGSARNQGFLAVTGGVIIFFSKEILALIGVTV